MAAAPTATHSALTQNCAVLCLSRQQAECKTQGPGLKGQARLKIVGAWGGKDMDQASRGSILPVARLPGT